MTTGEKTKVLFVCVHNIARSQMAEALLNSLAGERFKAESAGLSSGVLNPLVVEVMREAGIDTEVLLLWDDPVHALEVVARERGSRVIVVGSHGEGPLAGALGRHTPFELLHHSDVPVLVVPHRH